MKNSLPAHARTAALAAAIGQAAPVERRRDDIKEATPTASPSQGASALEAAAGLTDLVRFGSELQATLQRIEEQYPPAAQLKDEMLQFGEDMKDRHRGLSGLLEGLGRRVEELQAWVQQQLSGSQPAPELQEELQRIREEYPTAKELEKGLTEHFGHPAGRVSRLETRVSSMDERLTELALRLQALEDAKPTVKKPRSSSRKRPAAK